MCSVFNSLGLLIRWARERVRRFAVLMYLMSMYKFELAAAEGQPPLRYTYLVGGHIVGIITPSRKRFVFPIHEVSGRPENHRQGTNNGTPDSRLHPDEIAAFVVKRNIR